MAAAKYGAMKKAFATPGMQDGEKDALAAIAKNRGVSMKKAAAIGKRRTAKGLNTAGVKGPKGMGPHDRKVARGDAKYKERRERNDVARGRGTNDPTETAARGARPTPTLTSTADPRLRIPPELIPGRNGGSKTTSGPGTSTKPGPKPIKPKTVTGRAGGTGKRAI